MSEESMVIKSHKGNYTVTFCENCTEHLVNNLSSKNCHIIIDNQVAELYTNELNTIITHNSVLQIIALESNKSLEAMSNYVAHLVNKKIRRDDVLIAIGGGIIQDITCFLAATLLRGVDWYFYPTTLLAQADSCIGSKSSINCGNSKNLLGTFTPPKKVVIANNFLRTLEEKDIRSGVGEMLKVHAISGEEAFNKIATNYNDLLNDEKIMQIFIRRSLYIKKKFIEIDEFDNGPRNIFNYGHSFGHAIESATNFSIPHGIAVTIGIDMANWLSPQIGDGDMKHFTRMHDVLFKNYRGFDDIEIPLNLFISALEKDKKNIGNKELTLILPNNKAIIKKNSYVNDEIFRSLCSKYLYEIRFSEK